MPAALHGRRVLLVEDNELNRLVALALLVDVAGMHVTVIATTAHACTRDREQGRAAGMDDHVGKPLEAAEVFGVLQRRLVPSPAHTAAPATDGEAVPPAVAVAVMDVELGLRRCLGQPGCTGRSSGATWTSARARAPRSARRWRPARTRSKRRIPRTRDPVRGGSRASAG